MIFNKRLISFLFSLFLIQFGLFAQNPIKWSFTSKDAGNGETDLIFTGTIEDGWYTYSQELESDMGPVPTSINFKEGAHFKTIGKAKESGDRSTKFDKVFEMNLTKFKHKAIFTQRVKITDFSKPITGYLTYMVCNEEMCLPPKDVDFSFKVDAPASAAAASTEEQATSTVVDTSVIASVLPAEGSAGTAALDPDQKGTFDSKRNIDPTKFVGECKSDLKEDHSSLWITLLLGFIFGLGAVLTPCIFPMIPVTVGFFVKRTKDRATGLKNAFLYGFSILFIYVALGVGITKLLGPTALNEMSTNLWFNLVFFLVFLVFAISFFGFFEITLPSSWVNASDQMAGKGGLLGIFFMAFTLALVSFSCTGPLVGSLLVETARANNGEELLGFLPARPFAGLTGFGLALALPFALFAMFPGWLKSLPKSGGWMDNVKMTLGFVELALAFKFLSTADLVSHWGFLKYELFMGIWLISALLLALYQFGILGWKGGQGKPGTGRLIMGLLSAAFTLYLGYGLLKYESLSLLSGLAPPVGYSWGKPSDCPNGIDCYHDFDEALEVAKRENKPLFVDFTGYGCVNCRKMEENVWPKSGIIEKLRNDYVVVSLYVDDKARLFGEDKFAYLLDSGTGDKIRTVGDKWSSFQINNFNRNSQPWYVLMHHDGTTVLNEPRGYTPDADEYRDFLECGLANFGIVNGASPNGVIGATQGKDEGK